MPTLDDIMQQLQARQPLPPLFPTHPWAATLTQQIETASASDILGTNAAPAATEMVAAYRAGLLLWNDDLEASHRIAQSLENPTGSFWHAIIHRREGDAANSQYWWRRAGAHPAFDAIYEAAMAVLQDAPTPAEYEFSQKLRQAQTWLPGEFVKCCESARRNPLESDWLQQVQVVEMATLLQWCQANMN